MKILHLAANLGPTATGRRVCSLVPRLTAHSQLVVSLSPKPFFALPMPVEFVRLRSLFDLAAIRRLNKILSDFQPDLVHCWGRRAAAVGALIQRHRHVVATFDEAPGWLSKRLKQIALPAFAAPSPRPDRITARQRFGFADDDLVIVAADRFESSDAGKIAVWALDLMKPNSKRWKLLLLGDGPARDRVERFEAKLSAGESRTLFAGIIPVHDALAAADFAWNTRTSGGQHFDCDARQAGVPLLRATKAVELAAMTLAMPSAAVSSVPTVDEALNVLLESYLSFSPK